MLVLGIAIGLAIMFLRQELKERLEMKRRVDEFTKEVNDYLNNK
jgi:hypothetical protein